MTEKQSCIPFSWFGSFCLAWLDFLQVLSWLRGGKQRRKGPAHSRFQAFFFVVVVEDIRARFEREVVYHIPYVQ